MHAVLQLALEAPIRLKLEELRLCLLTESLIEESALDILPHVTILSAAPIRDPHCLGEVARFMAAKSDIRVEFSFVGLFRGPPRILFFGVTPTPELIGLQEELFAAVTSAGIQVEPFPVPGRTVFHSTLGALRNSADLSKAYAICERFDWPAVAQSNRLDLVEYFPPTIVRSFCAGKAPNPSPNPTRSALGSS